jgi:hypothetical protein
MFDWLADALCRRFPEPHVVCAGCRAWLAPDEMCDVCGAGEVLGERQLGAVRQLLSGRLGRRGVGRDVVEHLLAGAGLAAVSAYGAVAVAPHRPVGAAGLALLSLGSLGTYWWYCQRHGVDEGRGAPPGAPRLAGFDVAATGAVGTLLSPSGHAPSASDDAPELAVELWACTAAGGRRDLLERRSHTPGFLVRLVDGRVVEVPGGRVRLEDLGRRRTRVLHHDAVSRIIRVAARAGDRVELLTPIRPRDDAWSYRSAAPVGFLTTAIPRLRLLP